MKHDKKEPKWSRVVGVMVWNDFKYLTSHQIANGAGCTPRYVRMVLDRLVETGVVERKVVRHRNNLSKYLYRLAIKQEGLPL